MTRFTTNSPLLEEIERDMQRWKEAREIAEEIIRDYGWTEADDDFDFQVEQEAKRQWSTYFERYDRWHHEDEPDQEELMDM